MRFRRSFAWSRRLATAVSVAVPLALSVPSQLHAQGFAADSSPFRAGQWGVEFALGNYASVGLLKFRTPTQALLFDVRASWSRTDVERPASSAQPSLPAANSVRLVTRTGLRRYRPVSATVQSFVTLGLLGEYRRDEGFSSAQVILPDSTYRVSIPFTNRTIAAGLFAELGAAWMVTPNLSLGAAWNAGASYGRVRTDSPELTRTSWTLSLGEVGVRGNFYF